MRGDRLSWVHLSDWHEGRPHWDRGVVLAELLRDIAARVEIAPALASLDFLLFTGDLTNRGEAEQYRLAWETLLEPALTAAGIDKSRLFAVPGNHDIEEGRFRYLPAELRSEFPSREAMLEWLTDQTGLERLLDPFRNYAAFAKQHLRREDAYGFGELVEVRGRRVGIVALNSALIARRVRDPHGDVRDSGHLVIGEPQLHRALKTVDAADLRIALVHHPSDWLAEFDRGDIENELIAKCDFVLTGHVHRAEVRQLSTPAGDCVLIPSGAAYGRRNATDQRYVNGYNYVSVDLRSGFGTVYFRRWNENAKTWKRDDEIYKNGAFRFRVPKRTPKPKRAARDAAPQRGRIVVVRGREYCVVPGGPFSMGTAAKRVEELIAAGGDASFRTESPEHRVDVAAFTIGRTPVTNAQYKEFVDATGYAVPFRGDEWSKSMNWDRDRRTYPDGKANHPVTLISWYDARAYCAWLGARLPTEAEWEKAARGTDGREWPWGAAWHDDRCNAGSDGLRDTTPVDRYGARGASPYGVLDMAGNVWEWCSSIADPYPYDPADGREENVTVGRRVQRGGAFAHPAPFVRCAHRGNENPHAFGFNTGFRVALVDADGAS